MRIIGGYKRGHKLIGPPTVKIKGLKPMPDRVREAIFNILGSWILDRSILDLYAGTGAVGLEALSRGACSAVFVEISKKTVNLIKDNLAKLDLDGKVIKEDAFRFINDTKKTYDLIYIGFPHKEINLEVVRIAGKKIKKDGVIVLESDSKEEIPEIRNLKIIDQRIYGRLKITFLESIFS